MNQSFEQTIQKVLTQVRDNEMAYQTGKGSSGKSDEQAVQAIMTAHKAEVERKLNSLEVVRGDRDKDELTITFRSFDAALESEERI